jgi:hypothetical protein
MIFTVHNETTFIKKIKHLFSIIIKAKETQKNIASYCLLDNTIPESERTIARNILIDLQSGSSFYVCKVLWLALH